MSANPAESPNDPVTMRQSGAVLELVLSNPPANPLSVSVMERLRDAIVQAGEDETVRVVVLGHEGKVFSAGHDLKEMTAARGDADGGQAFFTHTFNTCASLMLSVVNCPKPVIARVDGMATAAGCQLVATCDLAVASEISRFCTPGVNIGLFCSTPMVALTRNVPRKQAMEMLLTGRIIDAPTAERYGLVNAVVAAKDLNQSVEELAQTIVSKSPHTLKIGKQAFYQQADMALDEAYAHTARVMVENMLAKDAEEGIDAFMAKRKPVWKGC